MPWALRPTLPLWHASFNLRPTQMMSRRRGSWLRCTPAVFRHATALGLVLALDTVALQAQRVIRVTPAASRSTFQLRKLLVIGSMQGTHDSFGRIMDVALDSRGRIIVADDLSHDVSVFDSTGAFVQRLGRQGEGPGEFSAPWGVAVDPLDSLYVWDSQQARITVFSPSYKYVRSFQIPPAWLINSIIIPAPDTIIIAAFAPGESKPLKILSAAGSVIREVGERVTAPYLSGYAGSLLGGYLTLTDGGYAYSQKSPWVITVFDDSFHVIRKCQGEPDWTTDPITVVQENARGTQLRWKKYVHSASLVSLRGGVLLNTVLDPASDTRRLQFISRDCRLLAQVQFPDPVVPMDSRGDRIVAVHSGDYPEVVIYGILRSGY